MNYISARIGGFGHHVRWILLLDEQFQAESLNFTGNCKDKVNIILSEIYPKDRTWHNWLKYEFKYRQQFNQLLECHHSFNTIDFEDFSKDTYTSIQVSPELCYHSYIKLHSSNNRLSYAEFINQVDEHNTKEQGLQKFLPNLTLHNGDILFQEELDYDFYINLINSLGFTNNYKYAKIIHTRWFQLHKQAEKDIIQTFTEMYGG